MNMAAKGRLSKADSTRKIFPLKSVHMAVYSLIIVTGLNDAIDTYRTKDQSTKAQSSFG